MSFYCGYGAVLHAWGPWGEPFSYGFDLYQESVCKNCGRIKQRKAGKAPAGRP